MPYLLAACLLAYIANQNISPRFHINRQGGLLPGVDWLGLVDRIQFAGFLIECAVRLSRQFIEWGVSLENEQLVLFIRALVLDVERYLPCLGRFLLGNNRILLKCDADLLSGAGTAGGANCRL